MRLRIIPECTAVYPIGLFACGVLAFPCGWRRRLAGIGLGVPVLVLINLLRLVSLCYLGERFPSLFDTAHLLVWQSLMIFLTVLTWLLWVTAIAARR